MGDRHKCTIKGCTASFTKPSRLTFHIRKHNNERPFICDELDCDKSYTNPSHLRRHKNVTHPEKNQKPPDLIPCDSPGCGLFFVNKYSHKKHQQRRHNLQAYPFQCLECSQGFHKKKHLLEHRYLHTGDPAFKCTKCHMAFTASSGLNKHLKRHKLHKCSECGKEFERWSLMVDHRRLCKKPKVKLICKICWKKFRDSESLRKHELAHTDYVNREVLWCTWPNCDRFYLYQRNLTFHVNSFHRKIAPVRRFQCTYPKCNFSLPSAQKLKVHLASHFKFHKGDRKTRCDKGTVKDRKSMAEILSGIDKILTKNDEEMDVIVEETIDHDEFFQQCSIALVTLQEKIYNLKLVVKNEIK